MKSANQRSLRNLTTASRYKNLVVVLIAWAVPTAIVPGSRADDGGDANPKKYDYRQLVQGLVSPNKPLDCRRSEQAPTIPPDYDGEAQKEIEKRRQILYEHCDEALPFLMEGSTNFHYSLTWRSDSYAANSSVGEVCLEIVAAHVEAYRRQMQLWTKREYYGYRFVPRLNGAVGEELPPKAKNEIEDWWRQRKGKSLVELQIEAFDWAIAKRTKERDGAENGSIEKEKLTKDIDRAIAARDKLNADHKSPPAEHIAPAIQRSGE